MRVLLAIFLIAACGLIFAPTGVPLRVFSQADASEVPPKLMNAARFDGLDFYAARLAVSEQLAAIGQRPSHFHAPLTFVRGRVFAGRKQMLAFSLEHARYAPGIQGWQAATGSCFGKTGAELTLSEAAMLVLHTRWPTHTWEGREDELLKVRNRFLRDMAAQDYLTETEAETAAADPLVYCHPPSRP